MSIGRQKQSSRRQRGSGVAAGFGLEGLEPRVLLSGFSWTAEEVYLLELVNRARANPFAEEARLNAQGGNLDLTAGLTEGELDRLVPSEPLALNASLTIAARAHSLDMAQRDYFDHNTPEGLTPTNRAQAQGYMGSAGENIAAGYQTVDEAHRAWIESLGHRKNVFSLHTNFDSTFHYDQFGPGFAFTEIEPYFDFYTQLFGIPNTPAKHILGVVYGDANSNLFYNIGEGLANVRIDVVSAADPSTVVGTYTTDDAGNYQIAVPSGSYNVVFTNLATNLGYSVPVTVSAANVKVDARASQLNQDLDDHASAGQFGTATVIAIDGASGDGAAAGIIELGTDTDLFRFTSAGTGQATIRVTTDESSLSPELVIFSAEENTLAAGTPAAGGAESVLTINLVQGQVYYLLINAASAGSAGSYAVSVAGPVGEGGGSEDQFSAAPGASLGGSPATSGMLTITAANEAGRPIIYMQNTDGSWTVIDLIARAGGPATIQGDPMTWTDPKDGRSYVAVRSGQGLILYRREGTGAWTLRNLTAEIAGAPAITGEATSFISVEGNVTVAGLGEGGDMILYQQTGGSAGGDYVWTAANITDRDLVPQGLATPAFAGKLISFVTSWNAQNIVGLDAAGNIQSVWWAPGLNAWSVDNLTAKTGAPPIAGGLTSYLTTWDAINLAGVNEQGELTVTWWLPSFGPSWANTNLTQEFDGPVVQANSVASYVTPWGGLNVVAADMSGELIAYWWAPDLPNLLGEDRWLTTTLSAEVPDGPEPAGPLTGVPFGDTMSIVGAMEDGHIFRYWWQVGGAWQAQDLTQIAVPG